jgi:hypothetical protein
MLVKFVRPIDEAGRAEVNARILPCRAEVRLGEWNEHAIPFPSPPRKRGP